MDEGERVYLTNSEGDMKFETKAIHVGEEPDFREGGSGDVVVPIHLSSTFARKELEKPTGGYEYSRTGNPTRHALEKRLAALENARFALAFSSGLAAEAAICMTLLKSGGHVIAFDDLYGGTRRLFNSVLADFDLEFSYVDARDLKNVQKAIKENTRLIWMETPTNPLMRLCDIAGIAEIGKVKKITTVVDNTFMSPFLQNPLDFGIDVVVHSTTKYLNGHSDSVGGAVMLSDEELYGRIKFNQNAIGAILAPFDSYLVLRGTKTLALRMERHCRNAFDIAGFLEVHKKVRKIHYPGLVSHPQHELAARQMKGFGGMLAFEIDGGLREAKVFLENLRIFSLAESLGGVESLIEHPALMTHASIPREEREKIGITDSLVRVSAGIEDVGDLQDDLEEALEKV
jgi:cystathionine gamma-lyase